MATPLSSVSDPIDALMNRFPRQHPHVCWLYGLSGAGKTTLATATACALRAAGHPTVILDGDQLRSGLCHDLGFAPEDRLENVRRTAEMAKMLCEQGFMVLVALMTPQENMRQLARAIVGNERYTEVYVRCDFATCAQRDAKGLYARAAAGQLRHFPGKDMEFEEPSSPHLLLDTANKTIESCVHIVFQQIIALISLDECPRHEPRPRDMVLAIESP